MKYKIMFESGTGWKNSVNLWRWYDTREEAQKAIDNLDNGICYGIFPILGISVEEKLKRIQDVLNSKTKAERIQDILNEE